METPSSFARITRSQAANASINNAIPISKKKEESDNKIDALSKQRNAKMERSALFDITNDSPIIGLALGRTPSALVHKKQAAQTPGSGEALLRGQVKILLQKVDEKDGFASQDSSKEVKMLTADDNESRKQQEKSDVTRALMFDFFDKPEEMGEVWSPCGGGSSTLSKDEDASVWSILVNTSRVDEDEDYQDADVEEEEGSVIDELCEGMNKISVGKKEGIADFQGKHTRFVYNSDEEIEKEEVVNDRSTSSILHLKGIARPQGKHLVFQEEEEEED